VTATEISEVTHRAQGERRQLTIFYCDLVGSTSLLERLGVERYRKIQVSFLEHCERTALAAGAEKVRFLGDGFVFLFGRVQAFEYDAERAIRLALELAHSVRRLRPDGHSVSGHFSIATGTFAVQTPDVGAETNGALQDPGSDYELVGEALHLGARLLSLAGRDQVVAADLSRRLAGGLFEYKDLGLHDLKGFPQPMRAWQVLGESHLESRFYARRATALTQLVGRDAERAELSQAWDSIEVGSGRVVLLEGEGGIGKSRLVQILTDEIVDAYGQRSILFCYPHTQGSSLEPVAHYIRSACGFEVDDSDADHMSKLTALLAGTVDDLTTDVPLVASLVLKSYDEEAVGLSPQVLRERRLEVLAEHFCGLSPTEPALIVVEDLHWADTGTLELLENLIARVADLPILLVLTFRSDERDDAEFCRVTQAEGEHVQSMSLVPLDDERSARLVEAVFGDVTPSRETIARLLSRADGNPLFIEDVSRDALETLEEGPLSSPHSGSDRSAPQAVPGVLWDSPMARLDRLGSAKYVAQVASVIGREVSPSILAEIAGESRGTLDTALETLSEAQILIRPPLEGLDYAFRHALIRETAYHSLLEATRSELHGKVAEVLKAQNPAIRRLHPELLAQHCGLAADLDPEPARRSQRYLETAALWLEAGDLSADRSEFEEALERLARSLDSLSKSRLGRKHDERNSLELKIRTEIARVQCVYRGYSATQVREAVEGAFELCERLGNPDAVFDLYMINGGYHVTRGNLEAARQSGATCLEAARKRETLDPRHLVIAHRSLAATSFLTGDHYRAIEYVDEAIALYDAHEQDILSEDRRIVLHHKSTLLCYKELSLLSIGRPEEAVQAGALGVEHANRLGHSHSCGFSRTVFALLRFCLRDPIARAQAEEVCLYNESQQFASFMGVIRMVLGELLVSEGVLSGDQETVQRGLGELQRGAESHSDMEARTYRPLGLGLAASANLQLGRFKEALALLAAAQELVGETGERWYLSELIRLEGECMEGQTGLGEGDLRAARAKLEAACSEAASQRARFWELRACTSLARLMLRQGERQAAHDRLAVVCDGFQDAHHLADMTAARELLAETTS
jgi:class 3 adenylate cyclase/tetratricopeptide (TPR) repeat protein